MDLRLLLTHIFNELLCFFSVIWRACAANGAAPKDFDRYRSGCRT
jgi:hypothetical protein